MKVLGSGGFFFEGYVNQDNLPGIRNFSPVLAYGKSLHTEPTNKLPVSKGNHGRAKGADSQSRFLVTYLGIGVPC